jgi:dTDP-4-dehydrorhamnose 3,5-epimerase
METNLSLDDVKEFIWDGFEDFRGEIFTTYKNSLDGKIFNHDKYCTRYKNCLVGIHGDFNTWKLVSCLHGRVYAVFVDNRKESKDFEKYKTTILSGENKKMYLLPPGIGNSFLVLSNKCLYSYKLSYTGDYIDNDKQFTLKWNDIKYNIPWPIKNPILSERDR